MTKYQLKLLKDVTKPYLENDLLDEKVEEVGYIPMAEVLEPSVKGIAVVDNFEMPSASMISSMAIDKEEFVSVGKYARLKVAGKVMMTDTPMEKRTNLEVLEKAKGRVLIAGLGLGMVLLPLLKKKEITHVTVIEKYQDVVDIVLPQLLQRLGWSAWATGTTGYIKVADKLDVVTADIFEWVPPTIGKFLPEFDTIYFDIWPDSFVKNLPEMNQLHKKFKQYLSGGGWMDSWTRTRLLKKQVEDKRFLKQLPKLLWDSWKKHGQETMEYNLNTMLGVPDIGEDVKEVVRKFMDEKGMKYEKHA